MVAVATQIERAPEEFQISAVVDTLENNCEKLIFLYDEIEKIRENLKRKGGITYRQLKRLNVLKVSQYLLDRAEKIVPRLNLLPKEIRLLFIKRAAHWSVDAIYEGVKLEEPELKKILSQPIKPTVKYLKELRTSAVLHHSSQLLGEIKQELDWEEIGSTYGISLENLNYLKSFHSNNSGSVRKLFDNLISLGFNVKKLNQYQELIEDRKICL